MRKKHQCVGNIAYFIIIEKIHVEEINGINVYIQKLRVEK